MSQPDDQLPAGLHDYPEMDQTGTVDLSQIDGNLALTPAERLKQHEAFLELAIAMRRAGMKHRGESGPDIPLDR